MKVGRRLDKIHRKDFITKAEVRRVCSFRKGGTHHKEPQRIRNKFAISLNASFKLRDHRLERHNASVSGLGDDGPEYPGSHDPVFRSLSPMEEPGASPGKIRNKFTNLSM